MHRITASYHSIWSLLYKAKSVLLCSPYRLLSLGSLFLFAPRGKRSESSYKTQKGFVFFCEQGRPRMEQNETGCQAPQAPILCVNNCGFFGTAATMNMCSKCYKDLVLKQEQAKLAASSIENIVNGSSSSGGKEAVDTVPIGAQAGSSQSLVVPVQESCASAVEEKVEKPKEGPSRCRTCRKRVGLTGFNCRCGYVFCAMHRYSDKHDCPFDYRSAGKDAIAKANPVVKAEKLDKI